MKKKQRHATSNKPNMYINKFNKYKFMRVVKLNVGLVEFEI